ncbi:MAG: hypothetical protein ACYS22_02945 [Planctomycetota bacterium]
MPLKTSWERSVGARVDYVQVTRARVTVGQHSGSGRTDNAGSASHEEFLAGRYQAEVAEVHGEAVLQEVVAAVRAKSGGQPGPEDGRRARKPARGDEP